MRFEESIACDIRTKLQVSETEAECENSKSAYTEQYRDCCAVSDLYL